MNIIVAAIILFAVSELFLTAIRFLLRKKKFRVGIRALLIAVKVVAAVAFAALVMAGPVILRPVQPIMMAAYIVLLSDAAADLLCTVFYAVSKKERSFKAGSLISLIFGTLFFLYAVFNMLTVSPSYHTYTSKKLNSEYKAVFIADLHVGSAQPFSVTRKTIENVKKENPDFVFLGGDITDDYTVKEEMVETFRLFKDFDIPVYYIYGNHDRQGHAEYAKGLQYTEEEFEKALTDNGIIVLKDEFAQLSPELWLLGREDITEGDGRKSIEFLKNPAPDAFLITVDHQPVEFKDNLSAGTDLQLSGHTHAGQLFPLRFLYSLIGGYVYGDYREGESVMNVSAGACGWRMPFRTDAHCNYEVIILKPEGVE